MLAGEIMKEIWMCNGQRQGCVYYLKSQHKASFFILGSVFNEVSDLVPVSTLAFACRSILECTEGSLGQLR